MKTYDVGVYSLEVLGWGKTNEYTHHIFSQRHKTRAVTWQHSSLVCTLSTEVFTFMHQNVYLVFLYDSIPNTIKFCESEYKSHIPLWILMQIHVTWNTDLEIFWGWSSHHMELVFLVWNFFIKINSLPVVRQNHWMMKYRSHWPRYIFMSINGSH